MKKYLCGIDENGFGPILGPLVITGVLTEEDLKIPSYIKDSKILYKKRDDFEKIEEIAILSYFLIKKELPQSPFQILKKFSSFKCPFDENICEKNVPLKFKNENQKEILNKHFNFVEERDKFKEIKVNIVCPYIFNEETKKKNSKFIVNLSNFCKIIKEMEKYENVKFFCGKIGGLTYYRKYLDYFFPEYEIITIKEEADFSSYKMRKKGVNFEINFYKNVEKVSPPACLSSIIGKFIREIIMESIRKSLNLEEVSGYRDKKTKKSIEMIDFSKFKKECVIRNS